MDSLCVFHKDVQKKNCFDFELTASCPSLTLNWHLMTKQRPHSACTFHPVITQVSEVSLRCHPELHFLLFLLGGNLWSNRQREVVSVFGFFQYGGHVWRWVCLLSHFEHTHTLTEFPLLSSLLSIFALSHFSLSSTATVCLCLIKTRDPRDEHQCVCESCRRISLWVKASSHFLERVCCFVYPPFSWLL